METYVGYIKTPQDALIIFEACRRGLLNRVQRRLSTKERIHIRSGSVFAWDEREAGMRRWTDGRTWSPSRVLGSFLTYRELDTKRKPRRSVSGPSQPAMTSKAAAACSYKPDGLIKQSFSICTATNQKLHLISYYSKADVLAGRLKQPSSDPMFNHIVVPKGLYPELNPLDTSGGHSATINSLMRLSSSSTSLSPQHPYNCPSPPPSLSSSPTSSDEDPMDLMAPPHASPPSPSPPMATNNNNTKLSTTAIPTALPPLYPLSRINSASLVNSSSSLLPVQDIALERIPSSEDQRQLRALYEGLRLWGHTNLWYQPNYSKYSEAKKKGLIFFSFRFFLSVSFHHNCWIFWLKHTYPFLHTLFFFSFYFFPFYIASLGSLCAYNVIINIAAAPACFVDTQESDRTFSLKKSKLSKTKSLFLACTVWGCGAGWKKLFSSCGKQMKWAAEYAKPTEFDYSASGVCFSSLRISGRWCNNENESSFSGMKEVRQRLCWATNCLACSPNASFRRPEKLKHSPPHLLLGRDTSGTHMLIFSEPCD